MLHRRIIWPVDSIGGSHVAILVGKPGVKATKLNGPGSPNDKCGAITVAGLNNPTALDKVDCLFPKIKRLTYRLSGSTVI